MGVVDLVAIGAAEQVERSVGPGAALAAYRALAPRVSSGEPLGRVLAGVLRTALATDDAKALREVAARWAGAGGGDHLELVIAACKRLARRGDVRDAAALSAAEVTRHRTARALYLQARTLEHAGDVESAAALLGEAWERAGREGADDVKDAARARVAELRVRTGKPDLGAAALGAGDGGAALAGSFAGEDPRRAIALYAARLDAPSRFARASAIASLGELATAALARSERDVAEAAILVGARHADARGDELTPLEGDRVLALLALWPDAAEAEAARARLRAVLAIAGAGATSESRADAVARAAEIAPELAADVARARALLAAPDDPRELAAALGRARLEEPMLPSPATWTVVRLALGTPLRAGALALAGALLARAKTSPPRGYLALARALRGAHHQTTLQSVGGAQEDALVEAALRRAVTAREPGATAALCEALVAKGWALAARGERDAAMVALREAKALAAEAA